MGTLWDKDGFLVEDVDGNLVECDSCPCDVCCVDKPPTLTVDVSELGFVFEQPELGGYVAYCYAPPELEEGGGESGTATLALISPCVWSNVDQDQIGILTPDDPAYYTSPISLFSGQLLLEIVVGTGPNTGEDPGDCIIYFQEFRLHRTDGGGSWTYPSQVPDATAYFIGDPVAFSAVFSTPVGETDFAELLAFVTGLSLGCTLEDGVRVSAVAVAEAYE